jgi:hypothetical protein
MCWVFWGVIMYRWFLFIEFLNDFNDFFAMSGRKWSLGFGGSIPKWCYLVSWLVTYYIQFVRKHLKHAPPKSFTCVHVQTKVVKFLHVLHLLWMAENTTFKDGPFPLPSNVPLLLTWPSILIMSKKTDQSDQKLITMGCPCFFGVLCFLAVI